MLGARGTVYLIGSTSAIPASIETTLQNAGYTTVRIGGSDRFATAVAVANVLGNPSTVLLATGDNFPDALSAGPAAAHRGGVVLLTDGTSMPSITRSYLNAHPGTVYAIGGPAAIADGAATRIVGVDRMSTAASVASTFFSAPLSVGVASGATFADAMSGGAYLARLGGPILLTYPTSVPASTSNYLERGSTQAWRAAASSEAPQRSRSACRRRSISCSASDRSLRRGSRAALSRGSRAALASATGDAASTSSSTRSDGFARE